MGVVEWLEPNHGPNDCTLYIHLRYRMTASVIGGGIISDCSSGQVRSRWSARADHLLPNHPRACLHSVHLQRFFLTQPTNCHPDFLFLGVGFCIQIQVPLGRFSGGWSWLTHACAAPATPPPFVQVLLPCWQHRACRHCVPERVLLPHGQRGPHPLCWRCVRERDSTQHLPVLGPVHRWVLLPWYEEYARGGRLCVDGFEQCAFVLWTPPPPFPSPRPPIPWTLSLTTLALPVPPVSPHFHPCPAHTP